MITIRLTKKQIGKKGPLAGRNPVMKRILAQLEGAKYYHRRNQGRIEIQPNRTES